MQNKGGGKKFGGVRRYIRVDAERKRYKHPDNPETKQPKINIKQ